MSEAASRPASPTRDARVPRSVHRAPDGSVRRDLTPAELAAVVQSGDGVLWVDIDATERLQHAVLEKVFRFHPLAIEDTLNPESRVKIEEYDDYLFAIIRGVRFNMRTEDPYDLDTLNLYFFIGHHYVVTVHTEPSRVCAEVSDRIFRSPDILERGPARLLHALMDAAVDAYFPILDQVDEFIAGLEERLFGGQAPDDLRGLFSVRRLVLTLRRHIGPQREVFQILANRPTALLPIEAQRYFRDVHDHVLRITDSFDSQRDMLSSVLEAYLSQASNRLGQVTKGLAVVATLSIPFVVVSGMWGMNFQHMPLASEPAGFWIMLVVQLALGAGLIGVLRWLRWL